MARHGQLLVAAVCATCACVASAPLGIERSAMAAPPQESSRPATERVPSASDSLASKSTPAAQATDRLKQFETLMDRFYRGDPLGKAKQSLNGLIDEYNRTVEAGGARQVAERKKLQAEIETLEGLQKHIENLGSTLAHKPDERDRAAVETYNSQVDRRNALVKQYNELGKPFQEHQRGHNAAVAQLKEELKKRHEQLDDRKAAVEQQIAAYRHWVENGDDLAFFKDLNRFYAELSREHREHPDPETAKTLARLQVLRNELGEYAVKSHQRAANGLVIVEATVCGRERCFLIVDTGASTVTISPALVEALGLTDHLGGQVEAMLAGGLKTRGRELVVPRIAVLGKEAGDVAAVMLDPPEVGVDGLLGLSYLKQFDFRIDPSRPEKLILKPKALE